MIRALPVVALVALLVAAAGCGSGEGEDEIVMAAAASLTLPVTAIARDFERAHPATRVRIEFAASGALAARVRQGAPIDLLVSADERIVDDLAADGLLDDPRAVAGNELVVLARAASEVRRPDDLAAPGVRLAIGSSSAPVGAYAREALRRLGPAIEEGALANVRSEELDARGLTAKLDQEVVDAAIAYRTDARPLRRPPRVIALPAGVAPEIRYVAGTTSSSPEAADLLEWLAGPEARSVFARAGFGPA